MAGCHHTCSNSSNLAARRRSVVVWNRDRDRQQVRRERADHYPVMKFLINLIVPLVYMYHVRTGYVRYCSIGKGNELMAMLLLEGQCIHSRCISLRLALINRR